jgi:3',5'-cyclic AMP phosphodiesterase CpdA
LRIIALDTSVPGQHHGALDGASLSWLQALLESRSRKPTLIAMHHPPFLSGISYLDDYCLKDPHSLETILRVFPNVEAVVCGHVHRAMFRRWAGTVVAACPSTATEIALRLSPDAAPASFLGPPACLLHLWKPECGLVSHTSYIGEYAGPYPFF